MTKLFPFLLIGTLGCLPANAQVKGSSEVDEKKEQWYQADLVVFLNKTSMHGAEKWPDITIEPLAANSISLKPAEPSDKDKSTESIENWLGDDSQSAVKPDLSRDPYIELPYSSQLLSAEANKLERKYEYRLLKRQSWLMPIVEGESSLPVVVSSFGTETDDPYMLEGTISVNSSRFLHTDTKLWYRSLAREAISQSSAVQPADVDETIPLAETELQTAGKSRIVYNQSGEPLKITGNFLLQESRKINRTEQIQYLDSPVIGVLFKLTPYEYPANQDNILKMIPEEQKALKPLSGS